MEVIKTQIRWGTGGRRGRGQEREGGVTGLHVCLQSLTSSTGGGHVGVDIVPLSIDEHTMDKSKSEAQVLS